MLGRAEKVTVDKENTTIVNGMGDKAAIAARVAQIKAQIEKDHVGLRPGETARTSCQSLAGGVAVLVYRCCF